MEREALERTVICPICGKSVSLLAPQINRFGTKRCPHCGGAVKFTIHIGVAAAVVLATAVASYFIFPIWQPSSTARTAFVTGAAVLAILVSGRLKRREPE